MPEYKMTVQLNVNAEPADLQAAVLKSNLHSEAGPMVDADQRMEVSQDPQLNLTILAFHGLREAMETDIPGAKVAVETINFA